MPDVSKRSVTTLTDVVETDKINLLWVNPEDFNSEIGLIHRSLFNASFNLKLTRHSAPHWLNVSRDTDSVSERARVSEWERKRKRERERKWVSECERENGLELQWRWECRHSRSVRTHARQVTSPDHYIVVLHWTWSNERFVKSNLATSIDVTHVTSRFYKWPPFNVWGAVAHTYLFFFSGRVGSTALLRRSIQALHKTGGELSFTARCLLSLCDIGKWSCYQRETFDRIFLAVSCHRALLKRRYLDSTTSNLEKWVLFFPEKGGGCTENERQKWRVDQWRIYSHTWSGAVGWSHTGVDGARHRCAQWGGDRLVCHQSNTQCTQRVVKKVGQSTNFGSLYLSHFLPDLENSPLIRFLLSCRKRNKSGNSVFRILKKSPEVSI